MEPRRIQEILAFQNENRDRMLVDLAGYTAGTHFTGEIRDRERIDTTQETIADLKHRIGKIGHLIAAYELRLHASA